MGEQLTLQVTISSASPAALPRFLPFSSQNGVVFNTMRYDFVNVAFVRLTWHFKKKSTPARCWLVTQSYTKPRSKSHPLFQSCISHDLVPGSYHGKRWRGLTEEYTSVCLLIRSTCGMRESPLTSLRESTLSFSIAGPKAGELITTMLC